MLTFNEALNHYECQEHFIEIITCWKKWHNNCDENAVLHLLNDHKYRLASQLYYHLKHQLKETNYDIRIFDISKFEKALKENITLFVVAVAVMTAFSSTKNFVSYSSQKTRGYYYYQHKGTCLKNVKERNPDEPSQFLALRPSG